MKKDNLRRKYKKYRISIFSCFGISLYFALIFLLPCSFVALVVWMHFYSDSTLNDFIGATSLSLNNDLLFDKLEMVKFKMDKFIADFSGVSQPFKTSSNMTEFLDSIKVITRTRQEDLSRVTDYVYGIQANSTGTYGFNSFHSSPCNLTQFQKIPQTYCNSTADGLTSISVLRSLIWTLQIETQLLARFPIYTKDSIRDIYRDILFNQYEIQISKVLDLSIKFFDWTIYTDSVKINTAFNDVIQKSNTYGIIALVILSLIFNFIFQ